MCNTSPPAQDTQRMLMDTYMKLRSFYVIDTGGGCEAYYNKALDLLITDVGGCALPLSLDTEVLVGHYDMENDGEDAIQYSSLDIYFEKYFNKEVN